MTPPVPSGHAQATFGVTVENVPPHRSTPVAGQPGATVADGVKRRARIPLEIHASVVPLLQSGKARTWPLALWAKFGTTTQPVAGHPAATAPVGVSRWATTWKPSGAGRSSRQTTTTVTARAPMRDHQGRLRVRRGTHTHAECRPARRNAATRQHPRRTDLPRRHRPRQVDVTAVASEVERKRGGTQRGHDDASRGPTAGVGAQPRQSRQAQTRRRSRNAPAQVDATGTIGDELRGGGRDDSPARRPVWMDRPRPGDSVEHHATRPRPAGRTRHRLRR